MTAPPVVTMDGSERVSLNGRRIGYVAEWGALVSAMGRNSAAELRAVADFLDQLAGANMLSEVVPG